MGKKKYLSVYEYTYRGGEVENVIAYNAVQAAALFEDCEDFRDVVRLKNSDLDCRYLLDVNEPMPDLDEVDVDEDDYCSGYKILGTFRERLKEITSPEFLCTTEF